MASTSDEVKPLDVDKGNLIPRQYSGDLRSFVMVDAEMRPIAEGVKFSDGRVVVSRKGGRVEERYADIATLVEEWHGRGMLLWCADSPEPALAPRRFIFKRAVDSTGFSGPGIALEGVRFSHGGVRLMWLGELRSLVEWASIEEAITTHGHSGDTVIHWLDQRRS
ncbi:hypothetical protein AB0M39_35140 [Streptomyces sp. NPDC051907]|uniref:hypothetical protein n=1 Tax=Streptomyces sp. NPDC051907 TaxID=3155284 RepID=UPI0034425CE8